jgi:hypothetical protein
MNSNAHRFSFIEVREKEFDKLSSKSLLLAYRRAILKVERNINQRRAISSEVLLLKA